MKVHLQGVEVFQKTASRCAAVERAQVTILADSGLLIILVLASTDLHNRMMFLESDARD